MSEELTPYVTKPIKKRPMKTEEVHEALKRMAAHESGWRIELLNLFDGEAHVAVNCPSFEDFCTKYLGRTYAKNYAYKILRAARVEQAAISNGLLIADLKTDEKLPTLGIGICLEIAKLPQEDWSRAYGELCLRDKAGVRTPGQLLTEAKRIVAREKNHPVPVETIEEHIDPDPPKRSNRFTPVKAETYDRGPEFDDEPITEPEEETAEMEHEAAWKEPEEATAVPAETHNAVSRDDCVREIAVSFVITFDKMMREGGKLEDLHMDVIAFRKKYEI